MIQEYMVQQADGLVLNANESPWNLPEDLRNRIADAIFSLDYNRYPDTDCSRIRDLMGRRLGVPASRILFGNGSDQLLGLCISVLAGPGQRIAVLDPDFSMYDYYASLSGCEVIKCESLSELAFADADLIVFSNPNNPTGKLYARSEIESLLSTVSCPVIVDEAYGEFAGMTVLDLVDTYPNLYVTRTLSKAFRSAGLRAGYLVTNETAAAALARRMVPYSVNAMTQTALEILIPELDRFEESIALLVSERERLFETLSGWGVSVLPSSANFLYVDDPRVPVFLAALEGRDVAVRHWPDRTRIRITIGTPSDNEAVLSCIKEVL